MREKESTDEIFVAGGEESYGLLKGTYVRDKDGAIGALLLAEYAAELKRERKTLYDRLQELFAEHGIYQEKLASVVLPGADGFTRMQNIMNELRNNPPKVLAGYEVSFMSDYKSLTKVNVVNDESQVIDCINGNVLVFELGDARCRVTVRPSGTEPKLKLYLQWYEPVRSNEILDISQQFTELSDKLDNVIMALEQQITSMA